MLYFIGDSTFRDVGYNGRLQFDFHGHDPIVVWFFVCVSVGTVGIAAYTS